MCCPIMCFYVLSSVLWCLLRFPHKASLTPVVCRRVYFLLHFLCLYEHSGVQWTLENTEGPSIKDACCALCCFYLSSLCVLCAKWCHFLWIVHYWSPFGCLCRLVQQDIFRTTFWKVRWDDTLKLIELIVWYSEYE